MPNQSIAFPFSHKCLVSDCGYEWRGKASHPAYCPRCRRRRPTDPTCRRPHGLSKTKLYGVWEGMIARCNNPNNPRYKDYGGRGISVSPKWREFVDFYADVHESWRLGLTFDRVNNDGNYEPGNWRWATPKQQQNNRRANVRITHDGITKTLKEWSEHLGIDFDNIHIRYRRGWSVPQMLGFEKRPPHPHPPWKPDDVRRIGKRKDA